MEKISVIIPFYSNAVWLDKALASVFQQTRSVDEIIVVNDGSKEDINDLKQKYVGVIFLEQRNQGAAVARNTGINNSTGDILFFLDSDDIWINDKVAKQLLFMDQGNYEWSATWYKTFGTDRTIYVRQKAYKGLCWRHLYDTCKVQTSTVAVRKRALFDKNFAPEMKIGQDVYLWFKLANKYQLGIVREELSLFRLRDNNTQYYVANHIKVRSQLWKKMEMAEELYKANRFFTRLGYKICYSVYKKCAGKPEENLINKGIFLIAWLCFRLDNKLLDIFITR